jgi:hypothetical protein
MEQVCGDGVWFQGVIVFRGGCCRKAGTAGSWIVDATSRLSNGEPAMPYHQLTLEKREVTSQMHYSGARASAIAQRLRRSPSTIGRELRRNGDSSGYRAVAAKEQTTRRRRERPLNPKDGRSFHQRVGSHGVVSGVVSRTDQRPDET